mmetsp:Transcript_17238/g.50081  ORF Transcript_17238/g.50081 Transcript_17238/m.50081 type:complete len:295 (+) Transcript_17238:335-1219(+)
MPRYSGMRTSPQLAHASNSPLASTPLARSLTPKRPRWCTMQLWSISGAHTASPDSWAGPSRASLTNSRPFTSSSRRVRNGCPISSRRPSPWRRRAGAGATPRAPRRTHSARPSCAFWTRLGSARARWMRRRARLILPHAVSECLSAPMAARTAARRRPCLRGLRVRSPPRSRRHTSAPTTRPSPSARTRARRSPRGARSFTPMPSRSSPACIAKTATPPRPCRRRASPSRHCARPGTRAAAPRHQPCLPRPQQPTRLGCRPRGQATWGRRHLAPWGRGRGGRRRRAARASRPRS